jgi:hypothetical protein
LKKGYYTYQEAKSEVQKLDLIWQRNYFEYLVALENQGIVHRFPRNPHRYYSEEWPGWALFLGRGNKRKEENLLSFQEAKDYLKNIYIKDKTDYDRRKINGGLPRNLPIAPRKTYKTEWVSWDDFLNHTGCVKKFIPFKRLKKLVKQLELTGLHKYKKAKSEKLLPEDAPWHPDKSYANEWKGWADFLGKDI